jgi:membrane associated rhomboid family serine protease
MTKSVKQILIINIIVFGITFIFSIYGLYLNNVLALYPISSGYFSYYQLITHLFAHFNPEHLFYNMLVFLIAGPEVERYIGKKFWKFYLLSGIFSSGLYCLNNDGGIIGASGAVFSVMTFSILISMKDIRIKKHILFRNLFFIFLILSEIYYITYPTGDLIGHGAHLFGSLFGVLYFCYKKFFDHPK